MRAEGEFSIEWPENGQLGGTNCAALCIRTVIGVRPRSHIPQPAARL